MLKNQSCDFVDGFSLLIFVVLSLVRISTGAQNLDYIINVQQYI